MEEMNERLNELTFMFSYVTGMSSQEAEKLILSTNTGKAIKRKNKAVLYEQQTDNLYQIAQELKANHAYPEIEDVFTVENIVQALIKLIGKNKERQVTTDNVKFDKKPTLKVLQRKQQKVEYKKLLQNRKQNRINVRRMENC